MGGAVAQEQAGVDFYAVLGLQKDCTDVELKTAYKKLALRWHPDRCSAGGNPKFVDEAKAKFQSIQEAYSVLSDSNKRFLYDLGIYDDNDDHEGMSGFLNEMVELMSNSKPNESFENLQELFVDMFQEDLDNINSPPSTSDYTTTWDEDPLFWSYDPDAYDFDSLLPFPPASPPSINRSNSIANNNSCSKRCRDLISGDLSYLNFPTVEPAFYGQGGSTADLWNGSSNGGCMKRGKRLKSSSCHGISS